jgi:hypothetical protein
MEFHSVTEKNEILSFPNDMEFANETKWMELENIILSEVNQAQKAKSCMFSPPPHMQIIDLKQMQQYYGTWATH